MGRMLFKIALTPNQSLPNALAGSAYEFVQDPSTVEIAVLADATGVLQTISSGPDILSEEAPIQIATINTLPKYPDDFFSDEADSGDRLKVALRDTTGVARTVLVEVRTEPL
jgi:hypothetical protein